MKCAKSRKVKYSASAAGSLGTAESGCRAASSATMRGEADPTWWTCSSALGSPAMKGRRSVIVFVLQGRLGRAFRTVETRAGSS